MQTTKNKRRKIWFKFVALVVIFISAPNAMAQTTNTSFTGSVTPSGITLKGPILNHSGRPLIFKEKHPVFWKSTYPFRKFVWHPLKMASDKTKFTKLAILTSDLTIKFGQVAEPYQPALSAGTTLLQAGTTAGVFIKGK